MMKKFLLTLIMNMICFTASAVAFSNQFTTSQGDAGDPNNKIVAMAAASQTNSQGTAALPAPAAVSPAPIPAQERLFAQATTPAQSATTPVQSEPTPVASTDPTVAPTAAATIATKTAPTTAETQPLSESTYASVPPPTTVSVASSAPSSPTSAEEEPATPAPSASEQVANSPNAFGNTNEGRTAFAQMVRNLMPLNPAQIVTLRDMFDQTQRAVAQYPGVPPKPTSSSILVNMSPGATPPVIRLRAGYVTSLVFLDSTGQPWPVVGYDLGNPKAFNIQPTAPNGKSDTLILQAVDRYEQGNLAVMLKDENTPVMLTLMPGQRAVDYRVDLRIPGLGPNASVSMSGLPATESPVLMDFLDGVAPSGAKLLIVRGAPAQAWSYRHHLFLRTRVTVLSPGWIASMNSPDGTHVYELAQTPIILASQRGEMVQLTIKGL